MRDAQRTSEQGFAEDNGLDDTRTTQRGRSRDPLRQSTILQRPFGPPQVTYSRLLKGVSTYRICPEAPP